MSKRNIKSDEDAATLHGQFDEFAKLHHYQRSDKSITLYSSDYWMRQARLLEDRRLTMTDTGTAWWSFGKTEMNWDEWNEYLTHLCDQKGLDKESVIDALTDCGLPGALIVQVPEYKNFFRTYRSKKALVNC